VREGLFSSLGERVVGARVLDLYAGTGAMGIEALSRGAAQATFVESDQAAVLAIRANLDLTHLAGRAAVRRADVARFVTGRSETAFNVVLADPPYGAAVAEVERVLGAVASGWLARGWTVALTRPKRSSTHVIPLDWHVARRLEYGDSLVILYTEG
jgi:16S rRNA (guanine966-N2)-methyltransferase